MGDRKLRAEAERLREALQRIDGWASADMWRLASGPATSKADMRHQAMVISDAARHALGLSPRGDWTWRDVKRDDRGMCPMSDRKLPKSSDPGVTMMLAGRLKAAEAHVAKLRAEVRRLQQQREDGDTTTRGR